MGTGQREAEEALRLSAWSDRKSMAKKKAPKGPLSIARSHLGAWHSANDLLVRRSGCSGRRASCIPTRRSLAR